MYVAARTPWLDTVPFVFSLSVSMRVVRVSGKFRDVFGLPYGRGFRDVWRCHLVVGRFKVAGRALLPGNSALARLFHKAAQIDLSGA